MHFDQDLVSSEWASCDTRLRLIAFQIVNGEGDGGYYQGLVEFSRLYLVPSKGRFESGLR